MSSIKKPMAIIQVIEEESYRWLEENHPEYMAGIKQDIEDGVQPVDIKKAIEDTQMATLPFAQRCFLTANYIERRRSNRQIKRG